MNPRKKKNQQLRYTYQEHLHCVWCAFNPGYLIHATKAEKHVGPTHHSEKRHYNFRPLPIPTSTAASNEDPLGGVSNKKVQPAAPFSPERTAIPRNDSLALKKQSNHPAVPSRTSKPPFARNNHSSQQAS